MTTQDYGNGYVPEFRTLLGWEWYTDIKTCHFYRHLRLTANYAAKSWRGVDVKRGQRYASYKELAVECGLTVQEIRTAVAKLIRSGYITRQETEDKSLFTITYYDNEININTDINTPSNTQSNTLSNTDINTPSNTDINTDSNTQSNTLSNTESTRQATHEQHGNVDKCSEKQEVTEPNKENKYNKREREVKNSLSPDFENIDLKKERPGWYDYFKTYHSSILVPDEVINISYGKFLSIKKKNEWTFPCWQAWVRAEKLEKYKLDFEKFEKTKQIPFPDEAVLDIDFQKVRSRLRKQYGDAQYDNWIRRLTLIKIESGECLLMLPSRFIKEYFETNYFLSLKEIWRQINPKIKTFSIKYDKI